MGLTMMPPEDHKTRPHATRWTKTGDTITVDGYLGLAIIGGPFRASGDVGYGGWSCRPPKLQDNGLVASSLSPLRKTACSVSTLFPGFL